MAAAVLVGFSGLAQAQPALASNVAVPGTIATDTSPIAKVTLDDYFTHQLTSRSYGAAYTGDGGIPFVFDIASGTTFPDTLGVRSSGGTGTVGDPFWIQTSGPLADSNITLTQRLKYVLGNDYIQNDMTITNNSGASRELQWGQYADCMFAGNDNGTSNISSGKRVDCVSSDSRSMSLIAGSPGAAMLGGNLDGVLFAMQSSLFGSGKENKCLDDAGAPTSCSVVTDNAYAVAWKDTVPSGQSVTKTAYESYSANISISHLTSTSSVTPTNIALDGTASYTITVKNDGPDLANGAAAAFALPQGMEFVSATGPGSYSAATGTWSVGSLSAGSSATITIVAKGTAPGAHTTKVTDVISQSIDYAGCSVDDSCGSALTVTVAEPASATKSTIAVSPKTVVANSGNSATITVTAYDAAGVPMTKGGALVVLTTTRGTASPVTDNQDGTYTATWTSTTVGSGTVSFALNGTPATATDSVEFAAGPVDLNAPGTKFEVSPNAVPVDTGMHTVTITLSDSYGNAVSGAEDDLAAATAADLGGRTISNVSESSTKGTYTATLSSLKAGSKPITVNHTSGAVRAGANAAALFSAGAPAVSNSGTRYEVEGGTKTVGQGTHTLTIKVKDAFGNPVEGLALGDFGITADVPTGVTFTDFDGADGANGVYTVQIGSTKAGVKRISVTIGAASVIAEDPAKTTATFRAGAPALNDANRVNYTVSPGEKTVHDESHTITVLLADEYGNPVSGAEGSLKGATTTPLPTVVIGDFVETATPGEYTASVDSDLAGTKPIGVTFSDTALLLKPGTGNPNAEFVAGAPSAEHSTMAVAPPLVQANGVSSATATLTLKDRFGNQITNVPAGTSVSVTASFGTPGTAVKQANGTFTAGITSVATGDSVIGFTVNLALGGQTGDVSFLAVDAPTVEYANSTTVAGSAKPGETIIVRDAGGVEIGRGVVNPQGEYTITLTTPQEHGDVVSVTATDTNGFESAPTPATVVTDTPAAPTLDPSNGSIISGKTDPDLVVTVTDSAGNELCVTTANDKGIFSCVPSTKPNHGDEVLATATNEHGNTSAPGSVIINQVAPAAPILNPSNGSVITGVAQPNAPVTVTDEAGVKLCDAVANTKGEFSCVPSPKPAHGDVVKATQKDPSGNTSEPGSVIINQIPPTTPVVDPSNGSNISGTTDPDTDVTVTDKNGEVLCTTTSNNQGQFSCEPSPKPGHGDEVLVIATDKEGNDSAPGSVIINQIPPTTPVVDPSNGSNISGTTDPDTDVTVTDKNGEVLCTTTSNNQGQFSCEPSPKPGHGDEVLVIATDKEGNDSAPGSVIINQIPPTTPVVDPSNGSNISGTTDPDTDVTVTDKNGEVLCTTTSNNQGQFSCEPSPKPGHGDEVLVIATDKEGNDSAPGSVIINQTLPDAPVLDVSNGKTVTGGVIAPGNSLEFVDENGEKIPGAIVIDPNGNFTFTPDTPLTEEDKAYAVVTDPLGNSAQTQAVIKTQAPEAPQVDPVVDGTTVTGCAEPGSTVTVYDPNGNAIGTAIAGPDCKFEVPLDPAQPAGTDLTVTATDEAGNTSKPTKVRVGEISMLIKSPVLRAGETQTVYGFGFQPGEKVTGVLKSTPIDLGTQIADADGEVVFTFTLSTDLELGAHSVTLTGAFSGSVTDTFDVVAADTGDSQDAGPVAAVAQAVLAVTGGSLGLPLVAGGLLLIGAGAALFIAKRRRTNTIAE